ncbi:hypothetical protein COBT_001426 [Conglomerata obtusa]
MNFYALHMFHLILRKSNFINAHTIESIYESLRSYQNGIIEKEEPHYLKQKHNEYIYFEYEILYYNRRKDIHKILKQILCGYCELKKNIEMDFDCLDFDYVHDNDYACNFKDIIKFMHAKSQYPDKDYKIYPKYKKNYRYEHNTSFYKKKKVDAILHIFNQNFNKKNIIINNCISTIEDYAIFLNEMESILHHYEPEKKFIIFCFHYDDIEEKNKWEALFTSFSFTQIQSDHYLKIIRLTNRFPSYYRSIESGTDPVLGKTILSISYPASLVKCDFKYNDVIFVRDSNLCYRHSLYTYMDKLDIKNKNVDEIIRLNNLDNNMRKCRIIIKNKYDHYQFILYSNVTKLKRSKADEAQDQYLMSLFIKSNVSGYYVKTQTYQYRVDFDINKSITLQEQQILNYQRKNSYNYEKIQQLIDHVKTFFDVKLIYNEPYFSLENISNYYIADLNFLRYLKCKWIETTCQATNLDAIIAYIFAKISLKYNNFVTFYLLKYELNDQETLYSKEFACFGYFAHISNIYDIQEINCTSFTKISIQKNMFIKITFKEENDLQNYYLFLPTLSLKVHNFLEYILNKDFYQQKKLTALLKKPEYGITKNSV